MHYTVFEYQLSAADKDHGNLLKANQVSVAVRSYVNSEVAIAQIRATAVL